MSQVFLNCSLAVFSEGQETPRSVSLYCLIVYFTANIRWALNPDIRLDKVLSHRTLPANVVKELVEYVSTFAKGPSANVVPF